MRSTTLLRNLAATAVSTVALFLSPMAAHALTMSPPYIEMTADPGDTIIDSLRLYNEQDRDITFYPVLMDFIAGGDEGGQPVFVEPGERSAGTGVAAWIKVDPAPFTLKAGQRGNLPFTVNVPKTGAQPGSHFGAVLLSDKPHKAGDLVSVSQQLADLIFLRVTGDVKEQASISEYGFKEKKVWYNYLPVDMFLRFENSGNTHLRPTGSVLIKNWYGRTVANIPVNDKFGSVLPLSIRKFDFSWGKKPVDGSSELIKEWRGFAIGRYKAELLLTYGSEHQILTQTLSFSVWPWRLVVIIGIGVLIAIGIFIGMNKANEKRIIRRYERSRK